MSSVSGFHVFAPCNNTVFEVQMKKKILIYFMQQWTFTHTYFSEGLSVGWFHFLLINFSLESRVVFLYAASHPHCVSSSNILICLCRWLLKFNWVEKRVKLSYSTERFFLMLGGEKQDFTTEGPLRYKCSWGSSLILNVFLCWNTEYKWENWKWCRLLEVYRRNASQKYIKRSMIGADHVELIFKAHSPQSV